MKFATTTLQTCLRCVCDQQPDFERAGPEVETSERLATGQGAGQHRDGLPRPAIGGLPGEKPKGRTQIHPSVSYSGRSCVSSDEGSIPRGEPA